MVNPRCLGRLSGVHTREETHGTWKLTFLEDDFPLQPGGGFKVPSLSVIKSPSFADHPSLGSGYGSPHWHQTGAQTARNKTRAHYVLGSVHVGFMTSRLGKLPL